MPRNNKDKQNIKAILKKVPIFKSFSDSNLEYILDDFNILDFKSGDTIFLQQDEKSELYIILKGKVKITLLSEEGEEFILSELNAGDFFGELSLIDGKPRSATVVAEDKSIFGVLKRESLLSSINKNPKIAIDLLEAVVERLRKATAREEHLAFLGVRDRLMKLIYFYIVTGGEKLTNDFFKIKKLTHKELASRIGSSREAVSKILKDMIQKQLIKEQGEYFLVAPQIHETLDTIL
jgi:CRP/FNR family transcriptional regulator/CRP/FNR family cyclic AMP-dependent transcriptional regulator